MQPLNPPQKEAVETTEGPLLVLAGAGTGKTKVLTSRIAYIISNNLAYPSQILAVTFSNKAAREMQNRINEIIASDGLNIGTFHSISTRILRSHIHLLDNGMNRNFNIIDQDEQIKLVKNIALENNIDIKKYPPKLLHIIISKWKDQGVIPEKVSSSDITTPESQLAYLIYQKYQKILKESNVADFGDLLLYCNQLLINNPEVLKYYQSKFKYILIDEYQDTNAVQYVWARMRKLNEKVKKMDLSIESNYQGVVAGVDEAGRGPLAGPVVAAAVIIDQNNLIEGIKDSKKLSKNKREELYVKITQNYTWSIGVVEPKEIDEINILEATKKACVLAVEGLIKEPSVVIVDGNMKFSDQRFVSYIKGDDSSISIAAASIIAKVTRDRMMELLHQEFPYYFWAKNSGYGTKEHISAIEKYGVSIHHRLSFKLKNTG